MNSTLTYKVLRNSVLTVLFGCYFTLIGIHACSIRSLITPSDMTFYANNKVALLFLCICWFSGLLLLFSSLIRTLYAFRYYWEWRCYRNLLGVVRYFILNCFLFLFPFLILLGFLHTWARFFSHSIIIKHRIFWNYIVICCFHYFF